MLYFGSKTREPSDEKFFYNPIWTNTLRMNPSPPPGSMGPAGDRDPPRFLSPARILSDSLPFSDFKDLAVPIGARFPSLSAVPCLAWGMDKGLASARDETEGGINRQWQPGEPGECRAGQTLGRKRSDPRHFTIDSLGSRC